MRLVSTVTSERKPFAATCRTSPTRSSTCRRAGRTSTGGSIKPVGRMTCSTKTPPDSLSSQGPGVAETPNALWAHCVPFLEAQRPVVHAGGQAEAIFRKCRLAAEVATEHATELRNGDVAFIAEHQRIVGHIFEQSRRRLARLAAGEIARIVLDAGARAGRFHHFEVEDRALLEPLRFQQATGGIELVEPLAQFMLDAGNRLNERRAWRDIVRIGVDLHEFQARPSSGR